MAYKCAGTNSVIYIGSPSIYTDKQPFTLSVWVAPVGAPPVTGNLICKQRGIGGGAPVVNGRWSFSIDSIGKISFTKLFAANSGVAKNSVAIVTTNGVPQHLAAWWNGGSNGAVDIKLFYNGSEPAFISSTSALILAASSDVNQPLCISSDSAMTRAFIGFISEVAWYSTTLENYEIAQLATPIHGMPRQVRPDRLLGYWPMNEFAEGALVTGDSATLNLSSNNLCGNPIGITTGAGVYNVSYY